MSQSKSGRPKGALNQVTNEAKRAILMAFDKIGGARRLADWVEADPANETLFWTRIFPRLLPRPAVDAAPAPDALPPVRGALTWKTPDWAKPAKGKSALRASVAEAAALAAAASAGAAEPRPPPEPVEEDSPPPPGWVAPG
ncbi:MAG: hypothetical protein ACXWUR_08925 [Allosphingosinicella sp.]